jgi:geranylgeranyl pyrophosphate synthase
MISGAPDTVCRALHRLGMALGIAFQIQDDLLDLIGDEAIVGKSLGKDLDKGKLTLPVILHLADATLQERGSALALIEDCDAAGLRTCLIESGAVQRTSATAMHMLAQAKSELPAMPAGAARDLLFMLADAVIAREY